LTLRVKRLMIRQYTLWNATSFSTIIPRDRLLSFYHFLRHHILSLYSSPHAYSADPTLKLRPKLPIKSLEPKQGKHVRGCLGHELHSTSLYQRETEISCGSESSPRYCPLVLLGKGGWKQSKFWGIPGCTVTQLCSRGKKSKPYCVWAELGCCSLLHTRTIYKYPTSHLTENSLSIINI